MTPEQWQRVEALFLSALKIEPGKRMGMLERECASEPLVHAEVVRLLEHDTAQENAFSDFALGDLLTREDALIGQTLGAYRLLERIGSGGMGLLYRAECTEDETVSQVAVKLIRSERLDYATIRRFELEHRALAALDHPDIARLYDGGTNDEGRPYLVMELLDGVPIDDWCDERRASVDERLALFVRVCRAVHFAHQNLVVHRDLKPTNILVDAQGHPKLVDFGVARFLDRERGAANPTVSGGRAFTPAYAAPEQLDGGPVTTAIDVYALGVLLYELLSGSRPFPSSAESPAEWHRAVAEDAPIRPSEVIEAVHSSDRHAALARVARRSSHPGALRRRLAGDLDRIVLMALRKEPNRRYASVQALADDVERHCAGRPVVAREDSLWYRTTKLIQRNRLVTALVCVAVATLAWGVSSTRSSASRARGEAQRAAIEATSAADLSSFLMDTFLTAEVSDDPMRLDRVRSRLEQHADFVRHEYAPDTPLRADLLDGLAQVALRLGLLDEAEPLLQESLAFHQGATEVDELELSQAWRRLGIWHRLRGELPDAKVAMQRALELQRSVPQSPRSDRAGIQNDLGVVLRGLGELDAARGLHARSLELRRVAHPDSLVVAESANNLALVHLDRREPEVAISLLKEALSIRRETLSIAHPLTLQVLTNLSVPVWQSGRASEAITHLETAAEGFRSLHAAGREGLEQTLANLGLMQVVKGDLDAANENLSEAITLRTERLGADHPTLASLHVKLAELQAARSDQDAAHRHWRRAIAILRSSRAAPLRLANALCGFGRALHRSDRLAEADERLTEAVELLMREESIDDAALGQARLALARCAADRGRTVQARELFEEATSNLRTHSPAEKDLAEARRYLIERGVLEEGSDR